MTHDEAKQRLMEADLHIFGVDPSGQDYEAVEALWDSDEAIDPDLYAGLAGEDGERFAGIVTYGDAAKRITEGWTGAGLFIPEGLRAKVESAITATLA